MPAAENIEFARAWLTYVQGDVYGAQGCFAQPQAPGWAIAFHCQQAVEKAYKGALVLHGIAPPKTHSLLYLQQLLLEIGVASPLAPAVLGPLTEFAVREKYPILLGQPIVREDAADFIAVAIVAVQWLQQTVDGAQAGAAGADGSR